MKTLTFTAGLLSASALLFGGTAHAADHYVASYGGDIQSAVDAAAAGDTVWVEDGTYVLSAQIDVTNAITVRGINGPDFAIIDGGGSNRCFNLSDVACVIADLTVTNGYVSEWPDSTGAGIYCDESTLPLITNCVITGNVADPYNYCEGGGLFFGTAIDCVITGNEAHYGGGTAYSALLRCVVEGNSAEENGGGMYYGSATNSIIINNTCNPVEEIIEGYPGGGGTAFSFLLGCTISGNETTGAGGGAYYGSLHHCTVTANTASQGGGVYGADELYNSIVWFNCITGGDPGGIIVEGLTASFTSSEPYVFGSDLYNCWNVDYSCSPVFESGGTGNITNNPELVTYSHISTNSPCIGAATNAYAVGVDIDGELWLDPPAMGCDENYGAGSITGALELAIIGPGVVATDYEADYLMQVEGIPSSVVVAIDGNGSTTNPVGAVTAFWGMTGTNDIILTAYNETYPGGISVTQQVVVVSPAASAVYVSDAAGSDSNDGSSWALAKQTIQAGIDAQDIPGGWVLVADGIYSNEFFPIYLNEPVMVQSTNGALSAIIDAQGFGPCINLSAAGAELRGFTVQNGDSYNNGGGINCSALGVTVRDCLIQNNYSDSNGGGMFGGTAVNCRFLSNQSYYSGAALDSGTAIGCVFADNASTDGSGAVSYSELRNCNVIGNQARYGSGGTYECDLFNSIVWYNTCDDPDEGENISYCYPTNVCSPDVLHGADGNITNAPLLVSSSHLAGGSPCIGAGSAAEAQETDIDGEAWLTPPSIGCDEYGGAGNVTGAVSFVLSGITHCAVGTTDEYSAQFIGPVTQTEVDFGDGTIITNPLGSIARTWNSAGTFDVVLTAWNDTYPGGLSYTQQVNVLSLEASTIYVALGGSDTNSGLSWAEAKQTIQAGVDTQTIYGGRVLVSNGTHSVSSEVVIDGPMKVIGSGGPEETFIDGGNSSQGVYMTHSGAWLEGFCITNCAGSYYGGGIRCDDTDPVITNCVIVDCSSSLYGGGGYYGTYIDCVIMSNTAGYGAGLYRADAYDCLITGNAKTTGNSYGGGAYYCNLYRCTISGNSAVRYGGGIYNTSEYEAQNCLIVNNTSGRYGAGGYLGKYYNCTIVSNKTSSSYSGGGVYNGEVWNSIVVDNFRSYTTPSDLVSATAYSTCSPDVTQGSDGNITNAPAFVDATNGNYHLSAGSPCIDAGSNVYVMVAVDLDGNARIIGGTVDMGAYEYVASSDTDGDGVDDADELVAGTDINDPNDFFQISSASNFASGTILSWDAVSNRLYSVYWTDDLVGSPFVELTNGLTEGSFEDVAGAGYTNGYYMIKVELAP